MAELTYAQRRASGPAFAVIVTNGLSREVDQIVGSKGAADREKRDLLAMDVGKVTIRKFATWAEAHDFEDKLRGVLTGV